QHPAAERDLVGTKVFARRAGVDRKAQARAGEEFAAELRRQADRGVRRIAGAVERAEDIWLQRRMRDSAAAVAEHEVGSAFDPALVRRQLDVMRVQAAEQLPGCGRRSSENCGEGGKSDLEHPRDNASCRDWCLHVRSVAAT